MRYRVYACVAAALLVIVNPILFYVLSVRERTFDWWITVLDLVITTILIDCPLVLLGLYVRSTLNGALTRLVNLVLERALSVTAQLFRQYWEEQIEHGLVERIAERSSQEIRAAQETYWSERDLKLARYAAQADTVEPLRADRDHWRDVAERLISEHGLPRSEC